MSYMNQVPTLPFRYDTPMTPLMQYRLDSPPYVPAIAGCPMQFQYLLPVICATVANEAAAKSQAHYGRMFLYNQLSQNNFANNEFTSAVSTVVDILMLNSRKGLYRTPDEGVQQAVNDTLSILTSLLFQNFPALQSVTPPEIVFEASKNVQAFMNLSNEIMMMKSQMQNQPMGGQPMGYPQPMMLNPSFGMGGMNPVSQPMMQSSFGNNQNISRAINPPTGNSPIFTQTRHIPTQNTQPFNEQPTSKYAYLKPKTPPQPVVIEPVRVSTPMNMCLAEPEVQTKPDLKITDWMPSVTQYYPPAINPFKSKLIIKETTKNGSGNKYLKVVPLEDFEMDRSKHIITSMSQVFTSRIPDNYGTREESLTDHVDKIFKIDHEQVKAVENGTHIEEPEAKEVLNYIDPTWVYESFIEASIFSGKFQQREHNLTDPDCSIYRIYRIIGNPILCGQDHSAFINELSACKSFREVAIILKETINDRLTSKSLIDLCYGIEKILTKEINNVLRNKMSIPNTTIESFIDDVCDVPDYLGNKLGEIYKRAFLKLQETYISQIVSCPNSLSEHAIECCVIGESNNPLVKVNFINHSYSITYLSVENSEMAIEPYSECASSILEYEHPLLYKIVTGIFKQDKEIDHECLHNLIVTSDDVVYEVQRGIIGTDIITISPWVK